MDNGFQINIIENGNRTLAESTIASYKQKKDGDDIDNFLSMSATLSRHVELLLSFKLVL
jgi:hypothetical protein